MTDETKIAAFLKADAAPSRDYVFNAELSQRIAHIRLRQRIRMMAVGALALGVVLFGLLQASGFDLIIIAAAAFADFASMPALMIGAVTIAGAFFLVRIVPRRMPR